LLARLTLLPYAVSSLRLLRRRGLHEAGDVREAAVAAARAAGLDGRRARVEADDARPAVDRHFRFVTMFKRFGPQAGFCGGLDYFRALQRVTKY
jgi:hypothetical protein